MAEFKTMIISFDDAIIIPQLESKFKKISSDNKKLMQFSPDEIYFVRV